MHWDSGECGIPADPRPRGLLPLSGFWGLLTSSHLPRDNLKGLSACLTQVKPARWWRGTYGHMVTHSYLFLTLSPFPQYLDSVLGPQPTVTSHYSSWPSCLSFYSYSVGGVATDQGVVHLPMSCDRTHRSHVRTRVPRVCIPV